MWRLIVIFIAELAPSYEQADGRPEYRQPPASQKNQQECIHGMLLRRIMAPMFSARSCACGDGLVKA